MAAPPFDLLHADGEGAPVQPDLRETAAERRETQGGATGEAPDAGRLWRDIARNLAIAGAAGLFLTFIGALGTGALPLPLRLAYWLPLMLGGTVIGHLVSWSVGRLPRARTNPWVFGALIAVAVSVPITLIVWGYGALLFGGAAALPNLMPLFGSVLVISLAMTAIIVLADRPGRVTHAPPAGAPAPAVRFLDRLPAKIKGGVIYAVSAEDHYLRVHTSKGADLILMRLSDAIAELDGLEGAQTHRSWWVARDAVESARRDGDKMVLTLKGGAEAPVSRPNVKPLRDAGWY
jgi:hypothetical protein